MKKKDVLGRVYEYFIAKFTSAEVKNAEEFYTLASKVKLLVEIIEPYEARIYDIKTMQSIQLKTARKVDNTGFIGLVS